MTVLTARHAQHYEEQASMPCDVLRVIDTFRLQLVGVGCHSVHAMHEKVDGLQQDAVQWQTVWHGSLP